MATEPFTYEEVFDFWSNEVRRVRVPRPRPDHLEMILARLDRIERALSLDGSEGGSDGPA